MEDGAQERAAKTRLSTGMALTIRVDRDLLLRLSPMATERRVPIRALIVDLLRERCNLPAIPPSPATRAERILAANVSRSLIGGLKLLPSLTLAPPSSI